LVFLLASESSRVGFVVLKTGEKIAADIVIVGAGVIPSTDYLKGSGITLDRDGGITVDSHLRVNQNGVKNVYAIG